MKTLFVASVVLWVTGCANVLQTGAIAGAYEKYAGGRYEEALKSITLAEGLNTTSPELKAELTYLKAKTYESMGKYETAKTLFEYLNARHGDTQYGYLAATWLEKINR